jgi:hypothetical protein
MKLPKGSEVAASSALVGLCASSCSPSYTPEFEQWPGVPDASVAPIVTENEISDDDASGPVYDASPAGVPATPVPRAPPPAGADAASSFGSTPAPVASIDAAADAAVHPRPDAGTPKPHAATIVVTTVDDGQGYSPLNVGAIWIAQSSGAFVKTLEEWGKARMDHLILWNQVTSAAGLARNTVDAITGATQYAFGTYVVYWNFTDTTEKALPSGTYRVYFETADWNVQGPNTFVEFTTGTAATFTYPDTSYFINLEVVVSP